MRISKRTLIVVLSLVLAMSVTAFGTVAYMTDRATATNTFTVGNVDIIVDEKNVDRDPGSDTDGDGKPDIPDRDTENDYKMIPGKEYDKDPIVTVKAGSEECYVRMRVVLDNMDALLKIAQKYSNPTVTDNYEALLYQFINLDAANWAYQDYTQVGEGAYEFEFWYQKADEADATKVSVTTEDVALPALFTKFTVPGYFTGDDLEAIAGMTMNVYGDAIQTATFADAKAAWAAFDNQYGKSEPTEAPEYPAPTDPTEYAGA